MTYERFEDTPAWQAAITMAHAVWDIVELPIFNDLGDLCDQLQHSSLSVSNDIAEGFEQGTTSALLSYLYIARGSAGETRSALTFAAGRATLKHLASEIEAAKKRAENVSRQLRGWANSLQNSDIEGQRRLNDQTATEYRQRQRTQAFLQKLDEIRRRGGSEDDGAASSGEQPEI